MTYPTFRNWALGQPTNTIGENDSDKGECVGLINTGEVKIHGLRYPIRDVLYAKDFLNGNNTRPDLYERAINDPNDYDQLPSVGDMVVLTVNDWRGHVAYVNNPNPGNNNLEVLEQYHNVAPRLTQYPYDKVVGWWHIIVPATTTTTTTTTLPPTTTTTSTSTSTSLSTTTSTSKSTTTTTTTTTTVLESVAWYIVILRWILNLIGRR